MVINCSVSTVRRWNQEGLEFTTWALLDLGEFYVLVVNWLIKYAKCMATLLDIRKVDKNRWI